jgi:plastocyanin
MKRLLVILVASLTAIAVVAATASAGTAKSPSSAKIVIRHQTRGCHAWSLNNGAYRAVLSVTLARGGTITFVDNDVMFHKLIKTSGPAVKFIGNPKMSKIGASMKAVFTKAGTYRFTTKAGEDYMKGVKTVGEDNVLKLTVKVA